MKLFILGILISAGLVSTVEAGSLPWITEHINLQSLEHTIATMSVFSILALSKQSWEVNLDHQIVKYDTPLPDYVEVSEYWQSSTGLGWQHHSVMPESEYFEMESMKSVKGLQYLQLHGNNMNQVIGLTY